MSQSSLCDRGKDSSYTDSDGTDLSRGAYTSNATLQLLVRFLSSSAIHGLACLLQNPSFSLSERIDAQSRYLVKYSVNLCLLQIITLT